MKVYNHIFVITLLVSQVLSATPFYGWSNFVSKDVESKKEILELTSAETVALELKTLLDSDKAFSAVLYVRPSLETE